MEAHPFHNTFQKIPFHSIIGFIEIQANCHACLTSSPFDFHLMKGFMGYNYAILYETPWNERKLLGRNDVAKDWLELIG